MKTVKLIWVCMFILASTCLFAQPDPTGGGGIPGPVVGAPIDSSLIAFILLTASLPFFLLKRAKI